MMKNTSTHISAPPLTGIRVVDFSTLLPGPMCSLILARAGAEVIKIERSDGGDEMRSYTPKLGAHSVNFALLNEGKRSIALNLKDPLDLERAVSLVKDADVLLEQFRPGVMDRLGLGYEAMSAINPKLIYCSITGWGQDGPLANVAGHDLNYQAEAGLLSLTAGIDGTPVLPNLLAADIAGGAYPAVMNILLSLRARDSSGHGRKLDVAMAENLLTFNYWGLGGGFAEGAWPKSGGELVTGGSPRYQIYRAKDGRFLAAAPIESKFWRNFLAVLNAEHLLDDSLDPRGVQKEIASIIATRASDEWMQSFSKIDACVSLVRTLPEAVESSHFNARHIFVSQLRNESGLSMPSLHLPVCDSLMSGEKHAAPSLGEANSDYFND